MDLFDWEGFGATPLSRDPYEHVIVNGFVKREALQKINADYPAITDAGSFPLEGLQFGPGFKAMVDGLESEQAVSQKLSKKKFLNGLYPA